VILSKEQPLNPARQTHSYLLSHAYELSGPWRLGLRCFFSAALFLKKLNLFGSSSNIFCMQERALEAGNLEPTLIFVYKDAIDPRVIMIF
jgi:hypothetical protein